jgi:hypothetical protein
VTDPGLVAKKLALIETYVRERRQLGNPAAIEHDVRERRFIEHTLQIAIQAALDVASHIASDERLGEPRTNHELFTLLAWTCSSCATPPSATWSISKPSSARSAVAWQSEHNVAHGGVSASCVEPFQELRELAKQRLSQSLESQEAQRYLNALLDKTAIERTGNAAALATAFG